MSAPVTPDDFKSGRAITEAEWRKLRLDALALAPAVFEGPGAPEALLPYQKRLLQTTAANMVTVVEKSRRTGMTWAAAADAVLVSASAKTSGGMDTFYIGYNLDMAREFIDTCSMWARVLAEGAAAIDEFMFNDGADKSIAAFRIRFASGFEIVALASRPRSLRGRQGYVILDEFAFHDAPDEVLKAAMALLIWGGKVLVISTHDGEDNAFNRLVKEVRGGRKPYALMRVEFDDALRDGLFKRIQMVKGEAWSVEEEAKWRSEIIGFYGDGADEELFCVPSEGSGAFLPGPLVEARMIDVPVVRLRRDAAFAHWPQHLRERDIDEFCERELKPLLDRLDPHLNHALGADYGRVSDLTVLWPLAVTRTMRRTTPFVVEMRNIPFDQQRQVQSYVMKRLPRFMASKHDATGLGFALAEYAAQEFGELRAESVRLSIEWYRENGQPLKTAFEDAAIDIPADADLASDMRAVVLRHGVPLVPPLKNGVHKDRHGDGFVALVLAYAASRASPPSYDYESVRTLRERGEEDIDDWAPREGLY